MRVFRPGPLSNRALALIFFILLAAFIALRWPTGPWLMQTIERAAARAGIALTIEDARIQGLALRLRGVRLMAVNGRPLPSLPLVDARLRWRPGALTSAAWAFDVAATVADARIGARVTRKHNAWMLTGLDGRLPASMLSQLIPLLRGAGAGLAGELHLAGDVTLAGNGAPRDGRLELTWQGAGAGLGGSTVPLGDYRAEAHRAGTGPWHWRLDGGAALALHGAGESRPIGPFPASWPISGQLTARADDRRLAAMLGLPPSQTRRFAISGTWTHPAWRALDAR